MPLHNTVARAEAEASHVARSYQKNLALLISANHILHYHGLVDAFGHISIRSLLFPNHYILAGYDPGAPALVSSLDDFIEYNVADSTPVYPPQPKGYAERYIHGEIYKRFPDVHCVVHSHSEAVIPFTIAGMKVQPVFHMAGFLGEYGPPTFDVTGCYQDMEGHAQDMLINNAHLGKELAETFANHPGSENPDHVVVLQHKHGLTCVGDNIQNAVYRAIYTQKNCALLKDATHLLGQREGREPHFLTAKETEGCKVMNERTADKAFRLWLREVEVNPLYRNDEGVPKNLEVGGMGI